MQLNTQKVSAENQATYTKRMSGISTAGVDNAYQITMQSVTKGECFK